MGTQIDKPTLLAIRDMPTVYDNISESIFRSYQILHEVKRLLELGTPGSVVLELIKLMEYQEKDKPTGEKRTEEM